MMDPNTYDIGNLKHSSGICIDFVNSFLKTKTVEERRTLRERVDDRLNVSYIPMMSPAISCVSTKCKYDMWVDFNKWIRGEVEKIGKMDQLEDLSDFCLQYSIGINKYMMWLV